MLVARLVGPSGEVVAIERDPKSIAKARARVTEAGFDNVRFNESDVGEIPDGKPFDAAVGRFILMYLPDPVAALRSISQLVRPGGVFAFQEPYWVPVLAHLTPLPLWSATASLIDETMRASANHEMGTDLYHTFVEAGLPEPAMRMELSLGKEPHLAQWYYDTLCSLRPQMEQLPLPIESLDSLDTLCTDCKPRLQNRRLLRAGLHLSGRGAAKLSLIGRALFSGTGSGRSPNPASNQLMKPAALLRCKLTDSLPLVRPSACPFFRGLEDGFGAEFFKYVSDDVDWTVEGTHPLAGHYRSKVNFVAGNDSVNGTQ
jgi:hypothetical protein